jgi:hypothetical protein
MVVATAAAVGTVRADTDARMSVVATYNPDPNTITFPVADTTGLFDDTYVPANQTQPTRHKNINVTAPSAICFSIRGGDFGSEPATDYLIRNGFGFPNDGCVLHIWQDDDCTVEAGTVGPLIQVDGKLQVC